jgi:hypothetical protein
MIEMPVPQPTEFTEVVPQVPVYAPTEDVEMVEESAGPVSVVVASNSNENGGPDG